MCVKIAAMVRVFAGGFGSPRESVKIFDWDLVDTIVGGKNLDCGPAELRVNLVLARAVVNQG